MVDFALSKPHKFMLSKSPSSSSLCSKEENLLVVVFFVNVASWAQICWAGSSDIFSPPFLREEGWGVRGERGISLKSKEKVGEKGGGRRVDPRKGSGASLGGGVLNIYFEG